MCPAHQRDTLITGLACVYLQRWMFGGTKFWLIWWILLFCQTLFTNNQYKYFKYYNNFGWIRHTFFHHIDFFTDSPNICHSKLLSFTVYHHQECYGEHGQVSWLLRGPFSLKNFQYQLTMAGQGLYFFHKVPRYQSLWFSTKPSNYSKFIESAHPYRSSVYSKGNLVLFFHRCQHQPQLGNISS